MTQLETILALLCKAEAALVQYLNTCDCGHQWSAHRTHRGEERVVYCSHPDCPCHSPNRMQFQSPPTDEVDLPGMLAAVRKAQLIGQNRGTE